MRFTPNTIYHVYNQGNNRQPIFFKHDNYLYFLRKMRKEILPFADFLCYCLMPNHFHWLLVANAEACEASKAIKPSISQDWTGELKSPVQSVPPFQQNLSRAIGNFLSSYTRAINNQESRTGSLFRGKTKAKNGWIEEPISVGTKNEFRLFLPENNYALQCFHYIHNNPVKANLVSKSEDWMFSSSKDYAGLRNGTLCNKKLAIELLGI